MMMNIEHIYSIFLFQALYIYDEHISEAICYLFQNSLLHRAQSDLVVKLSPTQSPSNPTCVQQRTKVFPSSWCVKTLKTSCFSNPGKTKLRRRNYILSYRSTAPEVGIDLATPLQRPSWNQGMCSRLSASTARLSQGVTKKAFLPRIMLRSPSPSKAAPRPCSPWAMAWTRSAA